MADGVRAFWVPGGHVPETPRIAAIERSIELTDFAAGPGWITTDAEPEATKRIVFPVPGTYEVQLRITGDALGFIRAIRHADRATRKFLRHMRSQRRRSPQTTALHAAYRLKTRRSKQRRG